MTLLALIAASWIGVSLVATVAFCALATAVRRGSPALREQPAPVVPLLAGPRATAAGAATGAAPATDAAPAVVLPAQRRAAALTV
jgi:hypothetical protein